MRSGIIGVSVFLVFAATAAEAPVEVEYREVIEHRLLRLKPIRTEGPRHGALVTLRVVVDREGRVESVKATGGPPEFYSESVVHTKASRYRPFVRDGQAVEVAFEDYVSVLPPEKWADIRVPFPEVKVWQSVRIILRRTECLGTCPGYELELHGDGTVVYTGRSYVAVLGKHTDRIPEEMVRDLVGLFRKADYFSLRPEYVAKVPDLPSAFLSLSIDGKTMSVLDSGAGGGEMPDIVSEIEDAIDRACEIAKWERGNSNTVPMLRREKFDFRSKEAGRLLVTAAQYSDVGVVRDLIDSGVPLSENADVAIFGRLPSNATALSAAASRGYEPTVRALIEAGASKDDRSRKSEALIGAARKGSLNVVRLLLGYGAEPGEYRNGVTFLMAAAGSGVSAIVEEALKYRPDANAKDSNGKTALLYATDYRGDLDKPVNRAAVARLLIKAGAQVNVRGEFGNTALHETMDGGFAKALIEAGADVNARNEDGETPLISTFDENVALALIEAGADLDAMDKNGDTALDMSRRNRLEAKVHVIEKALSARNKK